MTIGNAGMEGIRVGNLDSAGEMIDVSSPMDDEVDTARIYGVGF